MKCIKCGIPTGKSEELCINCSSDLPEIIDFPDDIDIIDIIDIHDSNEQSKEIIDVIEPTAKKVKTNKKIDINPALVITIGLLIISMFANLYLIISNSNEQAKNIIEQEPVNETQITSFNSYMMIMPSTWITTEQDEQLLIYDDKETWAASMRTVENVDYATFVTNHATFPTEMLKLKYQFTTNYTKEVNYKQNYLFKGKYYDYTVYVIITELENHSLAITDLKFKSEVDDVLLNDILTMCGSIEFKTIDIFKDNFNFIDFSDQVIDISQKE